MSEEDEISFFNMDFNKANQAVDNMIALLDKAKDMDNKCREAVQFISEMPCMGITEITCTEDSCAACYAKKVMEGGE